MIVDVTIGVVVLVSALVSFMRGFIREFLTIAGVVGGVLGAVFFGPSLVPVMRDMMGVEGGKESEKLFDLIQMEFVADASAYGAIFLIIVIVISIISHFTADGAKALGLGPIDRSLGVFFGVGRALILLGLLYLPFHNLMSEERKEQYFKASKTFYIIEKIAAEMDRHLPDIEDVNIPPVEETIKKKLEEEALLGTSEDLHGKEADKSPASSDKGYENDQRQRLNRLFDDSSTTKERKDPQSDSPSSSPSPSTPVTTNN